MFLAVKQRRKKISLDNFEPEIMNAPGLLTPFINLKDNQIVVCSKRGQNLPKPTRVTTQLETTNVPDRDTLV